jgi:ribosomal protein S18 acetylase RimI-like enzyme
MIVRPLGAEDAAAWLEMMVEATRTHPAAFLLSEREVAEMSSEHAAETVAHGNLHGLFEQDALIGFAGLHLWQLDRLRHRADIGPFYVAEARRGGGRADHLMETLAGIAGGAGVEWLDLWVSGSNGRARRFYARHGFLEVARREDAMRLGSLSVEDVLMTRRLVRHD